MSRILVPVDDAPSALCAVNHAAHTHGNQAVTEVVLLSVQPPLEWGRVRAFRSEEELQALEYQRAERLLRGPRELLRSGGMRCRIQVCIGDPVASIAKAARSCGCDAIWLGAPRSSWWERFRMAALARRIVGVADVPVALVS